MTVRSTPAQTIPAEERQVNLLLALRNTVRGMTAAEVVATVAGYDRHGGGTARRMFERDKAVLRDLGITITTTVQDGESRYSISEDDYALPEVSLSAREAAAVDLAASAWRSGALTATARHALTKIRAVVAKDACPDALVGLTADLAGDEIPPPLAAAVDERRLVSFGYVSASSGTTRARTVEPHRLRMSEGAWYLDALDRGAGAPRTFRLARITGGVSVVSGPGAFAPPQDGEPESHEALIAVAPGRALQLRARAAALADCAGPDDDVPEGWDVLAVPYADRFAFAGSLAALADAVVVVGPARLRDDVVAHLAGAAALAPEGR